MRRPDAPRRDSPDSPRRRPLNTATRRRLLGTLAALGATGLAGCDALPGDTGNGGSENAGRAPATTTESRPDGAETPEPSLEQAVSVGNPNAADAYVTVVAESPSGEAAFVRSLGLTPGERRHVTARLPGPGPYRVLAESAAGARGTFEWTADGRLDGLSVTLLSDGFDFWRATVCRGDCGFGRGGVDEQIPLVGDGSGRWYAPATVVLQNPARAARTARVAVDSAEEAVLTATYDVPSRTRVELPVTYRSGTYRIRVETAGGSVTERWPVPNQPSVFVDLGDRTTGCGPANSELSLVNYDDVEHAVSVRIESGEETVFADRWTLPAGERTSVVPVSSSGRYGVRARVDDGDPFYTEWWSCPPRGPATLVVDAAGNGGLSQRPIRRPRRQTDETESPG